MSGKKNRIFTIGLVLSVSLIVAAVSVLVSSYHSSRFLFELLNTMLGEAAERVPEARNTIAAILKEYADGKLGVAEGGFLSSLGYDRSDFSLPDGKNALFIAIGFLAGSSLFLVSFLYRNKVEVSRIRELAAYLDQVNAGKAVILSACREDEFSKLEDAIYKTVTYLDQTRGRRCGQKKSSRKTCPT